MGTKTKSLYHTDFVEWSAHTAELLRAGRLDEVDLDHAAEEIEDLGKSERKAVKLQLRRMLLHLIKQEIQPERDGSSWEVSIAEARQEILDDIEESPSLLTYLEDNLQKIYKQAVDLATAETKLQAAYFEECPFLLHQLLSGRTKGIQATLSIKPTKPWRSKA